jgi:hypothetical protein
MLHKLTATLRGILRTNDDKTIANRKLAMFVVFD